MASISSFFGYAIGSGQSNEITDPTKLPIHHMRSSNSIHAKYAHNNWHNSTNSSSFWNMVWHVCDPINLTSSDENTWVTITDITDAGYFCNILTPASNISGTEVHMRVTIDGTAYTMSMQLIGPGTLKSDITTNPAGVDENMRGIWGYTTWLGTTGGDGGPGDGPQAYYDQGFANYTGNIIGVGQDKYGVYGTAGHLGYITPYDYKRFNLKKCRFDNSLKVEIKLINGVYTGTFPYGAVSYIKDESFIL